MQYGMRSSLSAKHILDDEVVYGKIEAFGHLIHVSEIITPMKSENGLPSKNANEPNSDNKGFPASPVFSD